MKLVFLLGDKSKDFTDLNCLSANMFRTFWFTYYGVYQTHLPKTDSKQLNSKKGLHYNLEPLKVNGDLIPIYQNNELILIIQLYAKPEEIAKQIKTVIGYTKQIDFWDFIIKYDNIASVTEVVEDGMSKKSQTIGMEKKVYDKIVSSYVKEKSIPNCDMIFVYNEQKVPFTMLNINIAVGYSNNKWIKALEKDVNLNFIRISLGTDTAKDPLTQENLDLYCRNIRQAIMILCKCKNGNEFQANADMINNTEIRSYSAKHSK